MTINETTSRNLLVFRFGRFLLAIVAIAIVPFSSSSQTTGPLDRQTPLALTPGAPAGSQIEDFANVNLFNGNLNFALPLANAGGRGEIKAPLILTIERHWQSQMRCDESVTGGLTCNRFVSSMWWGNQQVGYGPGIVQGRGANTYESGQCIPIRGVVLTFTDPSGTEHDLRDLLTRGQPHGTACSFSRGTNFTSVDGTSITFVSDSVINDDWINGPDPARPTGYLLFADGTRYRVENGLVMWIRDRNGNKVSYVYELYNGNSVSRVKTITDTLGRTITVNYDVNDATYGLCDQIVMPGFGMTSRIISVTKTPLSAALRYDQPQPQTYGQLFPEVNWLNANTQFNPSIVSAVYLPNGQSYKFYYNPYGELARIHVPAGGAVDYDYQGGITNEPNSGLVIGTGYVYRRVVAKRVFTSASNLGSNTKVTTYSRSESWNSAATRVDSVGFVSTEDRASDNSFLSYEKHYFFGAAANSFITTNPYPAWKDGKEYQIEIFDTDRTTVLWRSTKNWQQRGPVLWWSAYAASFHLSPSDEPANDPRVVETTEVIEPTGANLVSKASAINPQTLVVGFDQHNNQTDSWQYDYGVGAPSTYPKRHAHTDFLAVNPANNISYADPVNGSSYAANDAHLRDVPRARQIYSINPANGIETLVAQSETRYDEPAYPLFAYGTVISWNDPGSARGNATTSRDWVDTSGSWLETHTQYDRCGNVLKTWDARDTGLTNPSQVSYSDAFSDGVPRNTYAFPTSMTTAIPESNNVYGSNVAFTTTSVYDFNTGSLVSMTDPNAKTTSYDYADPLNRLKQVTLPDTGRVRYNYFDTPGDVYLQELTDEDSARSIETRQYFDGLGRPIRGFLYDATASTPWLVRDTYYGASGRISKVSNPYRVSNPTATVPSTCSSCTSKSYDALGRLLRLTTPDSAQVVTSYGASLSGTVGATTTVTDQAGRKRRSLTDALGRLVRVDEPNKDTGNLDVDGASTSYTYDVLGNLRKVTQGGQERFFLYDSLGRLLRAKNPEQDAGSVASNVTDPITGNTQWSTAYGYDNNGNLTSRVDARNVTTTYAYDALNRNTTVRYSNGTKDIDRHYDGATNGKGRFHYFNWRPNDNTGFDTHLAIDQYDAMGRATNYRQHFYTNGVLSPQFNVTRTYDKAGHVLTQTYPSGHTVSYGYDIAGRINSDTGNLGDGVARNYSTGITYSEFGGLQQEQFGTQTPLYHKLHYNVRGQLNDIRLSSASWATDQWNWNRGAIVNYYATADLSCQTNECRANSGTNNNGNLIQSQHWIPANDQMSSYNWTEDRYAYDFLNRLKSVGEYHGSSTSGLSGQDFTQMYDYDVFGNRTINQTGTTQTSGINRLQTAISTATNRLYAPGETDQTHSLLNYDAGGNQIKDYYSSSGNNYDRTYDAENRMINSTVSYSGGSQLSTYTYDASGHRVKRKIGTVENGQVYGMDGELLAEYPSGAAPYLPATEYGYRGGELLTSISSGDTLRLNRFVTNLYYGAKQRDPTSQELQDSTNQLAAAGAQGQSQLLATASYIARSLFTSTNYETSPYRSDVQYVADLYYAYLQRGPDDSGLGWWAGQAASSRVNVCNAFEASGEFQTLAATLYGTSTSDNQRTEQFVNNFYLGAYGRNANATELQQQRDALNTAAAQGQSQVQTQAETMGRALFIGQVNDASLSNTQYVTNLYEAFLQRGPDAGGLGFWAGQASIGQGRQNVLGAFATCGAFRELAGSLYREANWLVADHLGTPRMIVNKTGILSGVKRHDYLPFGEELFAGTGGRATTQGYSGDSIRQQFTRYERDIETGLDFAKARYYDSKQGRFTSPDPLLGSAKPAMPQSWNRYTYCLNNSLVYVDPDGLTWYKKKDSGEYGQPEWFGEYPGDDYEEIKQLVYWSNHGWVALNPLKNDYREGFLTEDAALHWLDPGQEVSLMDGIFEVSMYTGAPGLLRGVAGIGARMGARFFAREAVETATEVAEKGLSTEGLAFERRFLFKHLEGTPEAAREASQGSAHVFNDLSTLSRVDSEIFSRGTFTGTRDGFARFGFRFERPIGTRIASDGTRTPLQYAEMKLRTDGSGLYHIIPRTGPR